MADANDAGHFFSRQWKSNRICRLRVGMRDVTPVFLAPCFRGRQPVAEHPLELLECVLTISWCCVQRQSRSRSGTQSSPRWLTLCNTSCHMSAKKPVAAPREAMQQPAERCVRLSDARELLLPRLQVATAQH